MSDSVRLLKPGVITPLAQDLPDLRTGGPVSADSAYRKIRQAPPPSGQTERDLRRMAPLTRYALFTADQACLASELKGRNADICLGITHGTTSYLTEFHDYLFDHGPEAASPNAFSNGVNNASLGAIARHLGLSGRGTTQLGYEQCGIDVLDWAAGAVQTNTAGLCYAGCSEEYSPLVEEVYRSCGWHGSVMPGVLPYKQDAPGQTAENKSDRATEHRNHRTFGVPMSEGSVFFPVMAQTHAAAGSMPSCRYQSVRDICALDCNIDLIISNAGAGPQDGAEFAALTGILKKCTTRPCVLFPKTMFGETFAVGAMLAVAVGWDILVNRVHYAPYPMQDSLRAFTSPDFVPADVDSVLVIAGSRDGVVSAGMLMRE